jgi:hypothetical protein
MRDVVAQACFQYGQALGHADGAAIAIGQMDDAAASFEQHASHPRQHDETEQAEISGDEVIDDVVQRVLLRWRAKLALGEIGLLPGGITTDRGHMSAGLVEAEQSQRRDQDRAREQERRRALEERLHAQPEIQPDAAMGPGDDQHRGDLQTSERVCYPERIELLRIELLLREQRLAEPDADDVGGDQERDAQPQRELQRLQRGPAELPALV